MPAFHRFHFEKKFIKQIADQSCWEINLVHTHFSWPSAGNLTSNSSFSASLFQNKIKTSLLSKLMSINTLWPIFFLINWNGQLTELGRRPLYMMVIVCGPIMMQMSCCNCVSPQKLFICHWPDVHHMITSFFSISTKSHPTKILQLSLRIMLWFGQHFSTSGQFFNSLIN